MVEPVDEGLGRRRVLGRLDVKLLAYALEQLQHGELRIEDEGDVDVVCLVITTPPL